jgi:hypothetical protein
MTKLRKPSWTRLVAISLCAGLAASSSPLIGPAAARGHSVLLSHSAVPGDSAVSQSSFPAAPADRSLVYVADEKGELAALPFEAGVMPLKTGEVAKSDKISYVELKGARAATVVNTDEPRLYLFAPDQPGAHLPFLVRLTERRGARRVTAITQKGLRGYAIASEEIVKPHYRVLAREGGMVYMEIRPREPLLSGEYAIVGTDLQRIAAFRVALALRP